ncbi:hypothetical protein JW977_02330 [Candidatus Falkowbacteria bacterium]|nr:hypothetical protein [Candidatus Falkowbacteria bacterium]
MGTWHKDPDVEQALIRLNDALCSWERATGRESTLILVPHIRDEKIVISQSGKPLPLDSDLEPELMLANAMSARKRNE